MRASIHTCGCCLDLGIMCERELCERVRLLEGRGDVPGLMARHGPRAIGRGWIVDGFDPRARQCFVSSEARSSDECAPPSTIGFAPVGALAFPAVLGGQWAGGPAL